MSFLSPQNQQDLQYCIKKYTNPCAKTLDGGVDILGYPIGNKTFMTKSLLATDDKLLPDTMNFLLNGLPSLQTSTTLFSTVSY
jgi:hypothetical protein